jgi:hypothetical protein
MGCDFYLEFLGHPISARGIEANNDKVGAHEVIGGDSPGAYSRLRFVTMVSLTHLRG